MTCDCFRHSIKMIYQKITNLLVNRSYNVPRLITKKSIEVHDQSGNTKKWYKPSKQIRFKTPMLKSDLCDYNNAYLVVKGTIFIEARNNRDIKNRSLAFKNNAPLIENAEELDIVMPMYNLIEYSKNYRKTTGSLWICYKGKPNNPPNDNYNADPITNSASFK